jgi:hypothetical protein
MEKKRYKFTRKPKITAAVKPLHQKHDKAYKRIFSRKRNFLHFLKKYIPSEYAGWVKDIDEDDLIGIGKPAVSYVSGFWRVGQGHYCPFPP